jgi:uncharacterized protein (TIGR02246 family)
MKVRAAAIAAVLVLVACVHAASQEPNPEIQKLVEQVQAAFNKGDAKALAALHTTEALRIGSTGGFFRGRAAIEKDAADNLAGRYKGMKLVLHPGKTQMLTPEVAVNEGTFEMTGGSSPIRGRYLNTLLREGGQWRIASAVNVRDAAPAK